MLAKQAASLDPLITEQKPPSIQSFKSTFDSTVIEKCMKR